jgi:hypothetical protein
LKSEAFIELKKFLTPPSNRVKSPHPFFVRIAEKLLLKFSLNLLITALKIRRFKHELKLSCLLELFFFANFPDSKQVGENMAVRHQVFLLPQQTRFLNLDLHICENSSDDKAFVPSHQHHQPAQQIAVKAGPAADGRKGESSAFNQQQ